MAEVRPFRGVHYNQSVVGDLAAVICPPYDIISPQLQQELHQRSKYNFVRLEFALESPRDTDRDNKYSRAAATLEDWLAQGVLKTDAKPAIYAYDQYFTYLGKKRRRRSMTVVVRLEEWSRRVVRPHEDTLSAPKRDRLTLISTLRADASPIFGLFEDQGRQIASVLAAQARKKPLFDIESGGEEHRLWAIDDAKAVDGICRSLAGQPLYIADGHHRYESALNYRNEMRALSSPPTDEPFDFVMMTLVDFADPGLVILPTHRLIRGMPESTRGALMAGLREHFEIQELPLDSGDVGKQVDGLWAAEKEDHPQLIMFGPEKGRILVLRVRDPLAVNGLMPQSRSELYRKLNVSVLEHVVLEKLLGLTREKEAAMLGYTHDREDAVARVLGGEYQVAFLLSPVKPGVVKAIADLGDRMPRKSTYFYPKLPSGLVFYRMA